MKYWAYINNEMKGPFEKEQFAQLPGFTPATLVYPETAPEGTTPEWVPASSIGIGEQPSPAPETPPAAPVAEAAPAPIAANEATLSQADAGSSLLAAADAPASSTQILKAIQTGVSPAAAPAPALMPAASAPAANNLIDDKLAQIDKSITAITKIIEASGVQAAHAPANDQMGNTMSMVLQEICSMKEDLHSLLNDNLQVQREILAKLASGLGETKPAPAAALEKESFFSAPQEPQLTQAVMSPSTTARSTMQPLLSTGPVKPPEIPAPQIDKPVIIEQKKPASAVKKFIKAIAVSALIIILAGAVYIILARKGVLPSSLNLLNSAKLSPEPTDIVKQVVPTAPAPQQAAELPPPPEKQINDEVISAVKTYAVTSSTTLESVISASVPEVIVSSIEWRAQMMDSSLYSISIRVPPASADGWADLYRFDYDPNTHILTPTNRKAQSLVASAQKPQSTEPAAPAAGQKKTGEAAAKPTAKAEKKPAKASKRAAKAKEPSAAKPAAKPAQPVAVSTSAAAAQPSGKTSSAATAKPDKKSSDKSSNDEVIEVVEEVVDE